MRRSVFWLIASFMWITTAAAQDLDKKQTEILKIIRDTASDICYTVQQQGQQQEISGNIQAQINGVIAKIIGVGGDMGAKLTKENYKGVLQEQLAETINKSLDCRRDVFKTLVDRMLPSEFASPSQPVEAASQSLPASTGQTMAKQPIYVFSSTGLPEDQDLADDLAAALKSKGLHVTSSKKSAAVLVDVTDISISDKTRVTSNGNITHYATAQATVRGALASNNAPLFADPAIDGEAEGDNTYDVREQARAAMIEAAARRFGTSSAK